MYASDDKENVKITGIVTYRMEESVRQCGLSYRATRTASLRMQQ